MPNQPGYSLNPLDVISEIFDGEAVVIQMKTGAYYSFSAEATALWTQLLSETPIDDLISDGDPSEFLTWLANEELLAMSEEASSAGKGAEPGPGPLGVTKFTDMADMLLADPIHDIDYDADGLTIRNEE